MKAKGTHLVSFLFKFEDKSEVGEKNFVSLRKVCGELLAGFIQMCAPKRIHNLVFGPNLDPSEPTEIIHDHFVFFFGNNVLVPGHPVLGIPFQPSVIFVRQFHFEPERGIISDNYDNVSDCITGRVLLDHNVGAAIQNILHKF